MTERLPIRWRLTLWYAALLAAALCLFALGLYVGLRIVIYEAFEEQVRGQAALALAAVRDEAGRLTIDPATLASLERDDQFLRLFDADGAPVIDTSASVGNAALDPALIQAALAGQESFTVLHGLPEPFGMLTSPVRDGGRVVGVLQIGLSRGDTDEVLRLILFALGIAAPIVLIVAAGGGYVLARRALAPVMAITSLAGSVGAGDLGARLALDLPDDELGRLARTFDGMLARIEDAFERQRRFTGDAAHELRTPLSLMRSQVDLALLRPRSIDDYQEALRGLDGDLERLTDLVGRLLTLARADAGQLPIEPAPLDLAATVGDIVDQYAPLAADAGVVLVDESSSTPCVADEDLLIQLLVNLLDNALAHTPSGGRISVGCRADRELVTLWVADNGSGIAEEHQARIFDRFYRIDTGRDRARGGTGLGLAICQAITDAHGGTISLTSRVGEGTRVELTLPARR